MDELENRIKKLEKKIKSIEKKDTNKKKRKPSAYNLYMGEATKRLKKKHPDMKQTEIMKFAAEEWRKQKDDS